MEKVLADFLSRYSFIQKHPYLLHMAYYLVLDTLGKEDWV